MAKPTIAWLAQGKVRVLKSGEAPRTIESRFAQSIRERALKAQQRHGWKNQGQEDKFLAGAVLWGRNVKDPSAIRIGITSVCRGAEPGQVLYSLETDELCAVLALENLGEEERRLWNKNDKRLSHLCVGPNGSIACSVRYPFGTANVAVRLNDESGFSEVTEGDSMDSAPRWVSGAGRRVVFQSAGVARDRQGNFAGLGPFSIQQLDIDSSEMKTIAEDAGKDLLTPQMTEDNVLYYIRRPYRTGREFHPWRSLLDLLLFPLRLVYAVFHFLEFFSFRYTGKKLTRAGGAPGGESDLRDMMIWGSRIAAQRNAESVQNDEAPDLVPKSWELVRQAPGAGPEVLAKGVLAFDLGQDGSIVYSNGNAIFVREADGKTERLHIERLIEQVAVVG